LSYAGKENIGFLLLNKINDTEVDFFIKENLGNSSLGQKSKFMIVSQIKTIFNWGIRKKLTNIQNPFINIHFKNQQRQRERVLTQDELKKLLQTCKEYKPNRNVYLSVYFAVLTVARANSILNIKKKDIDIKNYTISINNFKSSRQYKIQLNKESVEWLKNKILPDYKPNEYLIRPVNEIRRKNPPQPFRDIPKSVYKIMDELLNGHLNKKDNSDRDKVVNFHTLRRSIATNLAKNGTSAYNIDEKGEIISNRNVPLSFEEIKKNIKMVNPIIHPSVMFRKKDIMDIGCYNEKYTKVQDYELWFRAIANGLKVENLEEQLLYYRVNNQYFERKSLNYRITDLKVRWTGYNLLCIPLYKRYGILIPIVLGITPSFILKKTYKYLKKLDPRN
jgi:integrase